MTPVIARILLRYLSAALVAAGYFAPEYDLSLDNDLIMVVGAMIGTGTEIAYMLAVRFGWRK